MTRIIARLSRLACTLPLYVLASLALAGTNVGGPITVDTAWNLAGAPYTVTSDVTVDSGATLTIEPGVTVFMNPGTNLAIKSGALVAQGTAATPIVVTSSRDIPNPNPFPAPGDWGQLKFQSGTIAASTVLDNVLVKYGSGISLTGASPTLNRVSSLNHLGAAFTIDLASSPVGQGLVATGNTLNGISVPAGDIQGDVVWGLTGIAYVVTQGIVGVGAPPVLPTIGVPAGVLVAPGNVVKMPITLSVPAPAGGLSITLQSGNAAVATVGSPVNIPAGGTTVDANVTGVAIGTTTVTASAAGYTSGAASITVAAITLDIQPAGPITLPQGVSQSYQVKLSQAAPAGGVIVALADNGPGTSTSPSSVSVAQGQTLSPPFSVLGVQIGATTITLSSPGLTSKPINVNVVGQGSLVFNKTTAPIGKLMQTAPNDFTVQLRAAGAPFNTPVPVTIDLSSGDSSKATVPATVTIAAGTNTATFTIAGVEISATPFTIDATTAAGYASPASKIGTTVVAPQFVFSLLDGARVTTAGTRDDFTLKLVVPGDPGTQTATAATPASMAITDQTPPGIVDGIYTASAGGSLAGQLVIPAGGTTVTGYVGLPTVAGSYTVTASIAGLTTTASGVQTVTSPALQLPSTLKIGAGLTSLGNAVNVTRTGNLSAALTVNLSCAPAAVCSVPSSVTIPATAASAIVALTGVANGSATLTASSAGYASGTSAVTTVTPTFTVTPTGSSTVIGSTINLTVTLGANGELPEFSPSNVVVSLATVPPGVASVAATATILAGATNVANVPVQGVAPGTFTVNASSAGFTAASSSSLTIIDNRLTLAPSGSSVGVGQTAPMTVGIANPAGAGGVPVTLTSSSPGFVTVPANVTIAQNATSASFNATGVAAGPSTITAHATGYIDATATITAGSLALSLPPDTMVAPGYTRTVTLTLSAPAPAGGLVVNLTSANPSLVTVPPTVTFAANAATTTFDVTGIARGKINVTASTAGATSAVTSVNVMPITFSLVEAPQVDIPQGITQTWRVQWVLPPFVGGSPTTDFAIDIESIDPATAATSPSSITIPLGQSSALVTLTGVATGTTTLTLSSPGFPSATIDVNVRQQGAVVFLDGTATVGKGMVAPQALFQLYSGGVPYATPVPVTITLANPDPAKVTVPATVTVPAYSSFALFSIVGLDFVNTVVTASTASGYGPISIPVNIVPPFLEFARLDDTRIVAGGRDQFFVNIFPPTSSTLNQQLINPATVALSITGAAPAGIVGAFHDQAVGGNAITQLTYPTNVGSMTVQALVGQPTAAGSYTVTGSVAGLTSATSAVQTVSATGTLEFELTNLAVGKGLRVQGLTIRRKVNGQPFTPDDPLTITLTNSDPANVGIPATVTIPARQDRAGFVITGVGLTSVPAVIDAAATGYDAPASLNVSVVVPQIQFENLDTVRTVDSARDLFLVSWYVPGSPVPFQASATDIDVALSITDQSPAGIVAGIFDESTGGSPITKLTIPAGEYRSPSYAYAGVPTAPIGSYTVTGVATGIALGVSPVQTVTNAVPVVDFAFGNEIVVGTGMETPDDGSLVVIRTIQGYPFVGAQDIDVTLTSSDPNLATIPTTVTIPAEGAIGAFRITGGFTPGSLTLTLTAAGYAAAPPRPVSIVPPVPELIFTDPVLTVAVGLSLFFNINVAVPNGYPFNQVVAPGQAVFFTITASDLAVALVNIPTTYVGAGQNQTSSSVMGLMPGAFRLSIDALSSGSGISTNVVSDPITVTP